MSATIKKAWNVISWVLVAAVALLALLMGGVRLVGLNPYVVLSGSMEPAYQTGSLIYVKKVDPFTLEAGDVITFMMNEDTVATHRIVGVVPDEEDSTVIRFRTKGDANDAEDGSLVHYKNVIGTPIFSIPYLGYIADYIQHPPGMYIAISAGAVLLLLVFLPDVFADDGKDVKKPRREKKTQAVPPAPEAPREEPEETLADEIRRKTDGLLSDAEVEKLCRLIEAGKYDAAAAESLRRLLIRREAERKQQ